MSTREARTWVFLFEQQSLLTHMNTGFTQRFATTMQKCQLCPRNCGVNRMQGQLGYCRNDTEMYIASITPHLGEEPVLNGQYGICNVFFSHCNLQCLYCQNHQISHNNNSTIGKRWTLQHAVTHIIGLLERGIERVGFVSPSHMVPQMVAIVEALWQQGWQPLIVYNTNAYEQVDTLRQLEGLVDVYLPDCKYMDAALAKTWSGAQDYPQVAAAALKEMYRQMGAVLHLDEHGLALRGMIVRHLVLPGQITNSLAVLRFLAHEFSPKLTISLMAQYRPIAAVATQPDLGRRLSPHEYATVVREMEELGFSEGFVQQLDSADCYCPDFSKPEPFAEHFRGTAAP